MVGSAGDERAAELEQMEQRLEAVRLAMEEHFGDDGRRIRHALEVTGFARRILEREPGDVELVLATALLHDVGIREAERKYGSAAGPLQEQEGPPIAREILGRLGYSLSFIEEACAIIASHHSPGEIETDNFRIVWDADWLVNLAEHRDAEETRLVAMIAKVFMTPTGASIARAVHVKR